MNLRKTICAGVLALAAIAGTYSSHEGDLPPFYVNKVGKSGGLCVGIFVNINKDAKFYGPVVGGIVNNSGRVCGSIVGVTSLGNSGTINGLEASFVNFPIVERKDEGPDYRTGNYRTGNSVNGLSIGVANSAENLNGLQLGMINLTKSGKNVQIGVFNATRFSPSNDNPKKGILFNYDF